MNTSSWIKLLHMMTSMTLVGSNTVRLGATRDSTRHSNSQRVKDMKRRERREKVRLAKQNERRRQEQAEGGPAYLPGGF